ncbi:MAG: phage baseplate assembly protein V [Defluviitaleaceae bacterium]|nr:phage baseplate assembly protein V [Defluviitaleaceae bacterium]
MEFLHEGNEKSPQGLLIGKVVANYDDDYKGMIKVEYHAYEDEAQTNWMRVVSPYAGKNRGMFFHPEIDDEVAIAFIGGDLNNPCCIGSFWNNTDTLPPKSANDKNTVKSITTKSGVQITFSDEEGKEEIKILTKNKNEISISDEKDLITIKTGDNEMKIDGKGNKIVLNSNDIAITAKNKFSIEANAIDIKANNKLTLSGTNIESDAKAKVNLSAANVEIKAKAMLKAEATGVAEVKGAMVKING